MNAKDFFVFKKTERIGAYVLIALCLAFMAYAFFYNPKPNFEEPLIGHIALDTANEYFIEKVNPRKKYQPYQKVFSLNEKVDLNYLKAKEMYAYGFSKALIDAIFEYKRDSGFIMNTLAVQNFSKVPESEKLKLLPWLDFSRYEKRKTVSKSNVLEQRPKKIYEKVTLSINQATAVDFQKIKGIGPVLSKRIVKFRDKLGGFLRISQLAEVYGIEDSLVQANSESWQLNVSVKKLNVNSATVEELANHPYISNKVANRIVQYRKQNAPLNTDKLSKMYGMPDGWLVKLEGYLVY